MGKNTTPQSNNIKARTHSVPTGTTQLTGEIYSPILLNADTYLIQVDGSWDGQHRAGTGILCYDQTGRLTHAQYQATKASNPIHAEALALLGALQHTLQGHIAQQFTLCSDCQVLIRAVMQNNTEDLPSWEAANTVAQCIALYSTSGERITIQHTRREVLKGAHSLANWTRTTGQNFSGQQLDSFMNEMDIPLHLMPADYCIQANTM